MHSSIKSVRLEALDEQLSESPGLSFFDSILRHEAKEALEAEGEVFISQNPKGEKTGLFIYDNYETTGTIFTKSRDVFDQFYALKPSSYIFSELEAAEYEKEVWNIWQMDVARASPAHRFRHHVSIDSNADEIERFMTSTQPGTNKRWVRVALENGDKCFVVRIANKIVGLAWLTVVGEVARSHSIYVEPQFRRIGVMTDNFQARLMYLKSRRVRTLINEIAESNLPSSRHVEKIGEKVVGKLFLYWNPDSNIQEES